MSQLMILFLFVLEFYGPVNNEVMSSRSVNSGTVPGQPPSIFILTVPRRYFCCGSLLFLLSVFILWFICYVSDIFCKF